MPSVHTKHPRKSSNLAMWSSGVGRWWAGQILVRHRRRATWGLLGSICGLGWGKVVVGEGARWSYVAAAARSSTLEREVASVGCWQDEELTCGYREVVVSSEHGRVACVVKLAEVATMDDGTAVLAHVRSTTCLLFMDDEWSRGSTALS
jgi:hypothetical protein